MKKERKKELTSKVKKVSILHSIQTKVYMLIVLGVAVSAITITTIMISNVQELLVESAYGKMLNVATSYGKIVDKEEEPLDTLYKKEALTAEQLGAIFDGMEINGMESFTYYAVNKSGIISYHTDPARIGKPNTNKVIRDLCAKSTGA